jgi:hypothetical protein
MPASIVGDEVGPRHCDDVMSWLAREPALHASMASAR